MTSTSSLITHKLTKNAGKSSLTISLVLVGVAGIGGCGNNHTTTNRYDYDQREDCVKDWGETECPPENKSNSTGRHAGYSYYRYGNYNDDIKQASHAKSVMRGGFGSHAGGSHSGSKGG